MTTIHQRMATPGRIALSVAGSIVLAAVLAACGKDPMSVPLITPGNVASVTLAPDSLAVGDTNVVAVTLQDAQGNTLDNRTSDLVWSSSDTTIATVNGGQVIGIGAGTATITAAVDGQQGQTTVQVTPPAP